MLWRQSEIHISYWTKTQINIWNLPLIPSELYLHEIKGKTGRGPDLYCQISNVTRSLWTAASFARGKTKGSSNTTTTQINIQPQSSIQGEKGSNQIKKILQVLIYQRKEKTECLLGIKSTEIQLWSRPNMDVPVGIKTKHGIAQPRSKSICFFRKWWCRW